MPARSGNQGSRRLWFPREAATMGARTPPASSLRSDSFEWSGSCAHQREHRESEDKAGNRQACCEREVEARESQLIDQVRNHVDLTASDELRRCEGAESPCKRRRHAGNDPWRREGKRHRDKRADRPGAKARGGTLIVP